MTAAARAGAQPRTRTGARRAPAKAAPKRRLEVVADQQRVGVISRLGTVLFAVVFAALLGAALFHAIVVSDQLALDHLEVDLDTAREESVRLRLEVAQLEAPARILDEAGRLGMVLPAEQAYLTGIPLGVGQLPPPTEDPFRRGEGS